MIQVSVIIVNYNTFQLTSEAVESIIRHTKGVSYEIIVVDNASTECDPGLFEERFPSIKLVRNLDNSGFSKGNNLGIKRAKGETILLFNSDAACINDALTITYNVLASELKVGVATSRLEYPDGQLQYQCGRFPSVRLQLFELLRIQKLVGPVHAGQILQGGFFDHQSELEPDWVWGTYFHFKHKLLEKLPGHKLPDDFFMYAEDLEWSFVIRKLGYSIRYVPVARVLHHFSQSTKKEKRLNQGNMILQNEDIFLNREYGWATTKAYYLAKMANFFLLRGNTEHRRLMLQRYSKMLRGKPL